MLNSSSTLVLNDYAPTSGSMQAPEALLVPADLVVAVESRIAEVRLELREQIQQLESRMVEARLKDRERIRELESRVAGVGGSR